MTEREKIIEVIKQASEQAYADFHELFREGVKRVRDGEISCFTNRDVRPTHDEILADKLIEAGFGYIKDLKTELRSKVDYIHEQDEVIKDYKLRAGVAEVFLALIDYQFEKMKHRAEVAERKARLLSKWLADKIRKNYPWQACFEAAYKQVEKDLAEEKKYDRKRKNN